MNDQIDIFGVDPRARRGDPDTSHEAALSMRRAATHQRMQVLRSLVMDGANTANGIDEAINDGRHMAGRRLHELEAMGAARRTDLKAPTTSGRSAQVWKATTLGENMIARIDRSRR